MDGVFGVVVSVVIAIAAIAFGNWFGLLFFRLFEWAGRLCSKPFTRYDRLAPLGLLSFASNWGLLFNNIFILALIVGVAGTFLTWGIAAGASTVSWWAFAIACLLYFIGGIGQGLNRGIRLRVLTGAGFTRQEVDLLDRHRLSLTPEEAATVTALYETITGYFNVHPALRANIMRQAPAPPRLPVLPQDAGEVIAAFGAVLEAVSSGPEHHAVYPESSLPYPKPFIQSAFEAALEHVTDPQLQDQLKCGLIYLEDFVPDDEVATNPREQGYLLVRQLRADLAGATPPSEPAA
jgi:hypothetical protein